MNRDTSHTSHFKLYTCAQSVLTSHMMLHAHAWLKFKLCLSLKIVFISLTQCLVPSTEHSAHLPHPLPLFQVYNGCSHPEIPALIHENPGVTDTLIQNHAHVDVFLLPSWRCVVVALFASSPFFVWLQLDKRPACWSGAKLFSWSSEERENKESRQIHEDVG